ncbi:hypothetical protein ES703_65151 [subsurface metagenome]
MCPYRKATLRRMPPVTRKYAKLLGELESVLRKGKNLVEEIRRLELDSRALVHAKQMPQHLPLQNSGGDFIVTEHEERR